MPASLKYIALHLLTTWQIFRTSPWLILGLVLVCAILAFLMMPHDAGWLQQIRKDPKFYPDVHDFAGKVSYYSMYVFTPLLLCTVLWLAGWRLKKIHLKRAALVCFVAATVAGILVNFLRPGFGRPRPRAEIEDRFYYFQFSSNMLGFPSGHVMSNVAGATALTILQPWVGVPYVVIAAASGWSRMQRNAHYPTDVVVGALLGFGVGIACARGAAVMRKEGDPLEIESLDPTSASSRNSSPGEV
jgi:membrane-associated phospholipid phosphatase